MIFHEWYSAYYRTVREILKAALDHPLRTEEIYGIIEKYAFQESMLYILPALQEQRWQLLYEDGTTPLCSVPPMPYTTLEKRWLASVMLDPRVRLFCDQPMDLGEAEPLFLPEDICVFDRYGDGDDYQNERYQKNFRQILDGVRKKYPLQITMKSRKNTWLKVTVMPEYLEYSPKDDKFRLITSYNPLVSTINLGRIVDCCAAESAGGKLSKRTPRKKCSVVFELTDQRKALERVLLHFAHLEKEAEKIDETHYRITLQYDKDDEAEMIIRILSFGPMVRVISPQSFVEQIKERLYRQKSCEQ